ncbi:hypothetical protein Acsp06_17060 [Actinomycetospora sp. NBRC 106375]|uniref:DUF1707 SHOCT-like domain-containing protein n=1 Tax=Actinomycetospora sp. NBRC 106375 TaxID=3032207 RepID=UPI00249FF25C|nr:DUF1707 domain-containing protein [Actinomycetospora sp. NBRC 106375]GLZ45521.1 hypothetical protein Acsp06_17060 [Actinomycetospora sp. NBRC 106375]
MDHDHGDDAGAAGGRPEPDLRVSDDERTAALDALGVHLGAGRLDVDEFGDRSERAAVAVRRSDLEALFTDLPAPHPPLPRPPAPVEEAAVRARPVPPGPHRPHPAAALPVFALVMVLVLVMPALAIGAATTGSGAGLLIIPLLFIVLGHARRGRWHGHGPGGHRGPHDRW